MTAALIAIDDETTAITVVDGNTTDVFVVPCGVRSLGSRHIHSDPPLPEELTNAIGEMLDHLEDAKRELPQLRDARAVVIEGAIPRTVAEVEVGAPIDASEFVLGRNAAEEVFRTLATENRADRQCNPGLPLELVDVVVGGCCLIVGLIRGLQLDGVIVLMGAGTAPIGEAGAP